MEMTREEAKEVFLNRGFIDGIYDGNKWRESCIVISKWLEQEPTTKNDLGVDLISRAEVLKLIYDYKENHSENRKEYPINYGTLIDMIRWVRNLPSVTPQESKTGHWETRPFSTFCSECGFELTINNTNYCPNCGANMCEAQESEDNK